MKALLALLPCIGLAIAGTWWWGPGKVRAAREREPLSLVVPRERAATSSAPAAPEAAAVITTEVDRPFERQPAPPIVDLEPQPDPNSRPHGPDAVDGFDRHDEESLENVSRIFSERLNFPVKIHVVQRIENGEGVLLVEPAAAEPADGQVLTYHDNGIKATQGELQHGDRQGLWSEWYSNGQKSSEGNYFHGTKHGYWTSWYENGQIREAGEFLYGRREGLWTSWYENGQKERVGYYRNDHAEDRVTIWYPDGTKAAEGQFSNELREGLWMEWHENAFLASRGSYLHGRADGPWEFWDPDGVLDIGLSGRYLNGKRLP